jgi:hypothetical protein
MARLLWQQRQDVGSALVGLAFDSDRNVAVLLTQTEDGNAWEQVTNMGPRARGAHAMTGTSGATLSSAG